MNVQKRIPKTLTILLYIASVAVLAISPACAADAATPAMIGQDAGHGPGHHGAFNAMFNATMQGPSMNATMQADHLQSLITKLGEQGIDISEVQADLDADNTDAVRTWFQEYFKDRPMAFGNRTGIKPERNATMPGPFMNASLQAGHLQSLITKLGEQGVDIAEVQADLDAGNTDAVKEWITAYRKDHPGNRSNDSGNHWGNLTAGSSFPKFAAQHMDAGNRTFMNRTVRAHHAGFAELAS